MVVARGAWFDLTVEPTTQDEAWGSHPPRVLPDAAEPGTGCLTEVWHLVVIELAALIAFALLQVDADVWRWWRDGERLDVIVVELPSDKGGPLVVLDPATELEHTVSSFYSTPDVGDEIEVIVSPKDPSDIATRSELITYLVLWVVTVAAAFTAPVAYARRRLRTPQRSR